MLEKRKEDSESIGKYQGLIMSAIIGAVIVFAAPTIIVTITDPDCDDGQGGTLSADACLFKAPGAFGSGIADRIEELFEILMWAVRIVLVVAVVVGILMLSVAPSGTQPYRAA